MITPRPAVESSSRHQSELPSLHQSSPKEKLMMTPDNHARRSRLLQGLGLLVLSIAIVAGLGWAAGRQILTPSAASGSPGAGAPATSLGDGPASAPKVDGSYPPPASPSPTPEPDGGGRFPPPSIEHEIVTRDDSPFGELIAAVESTLAGSSGQTFSPWVDHLGSGLALDYPGSTEGLGIRMSPDEAATIVNQLFATGAEPTIQGYFEEAGCDRTLPEVPPCAAVLVVTGLGGPVPMPTKHPSETLGPPAPDEIPLEAAAWSIYPDSTGPYWTDWWLGNGYHELLESLVQEGHGTYFVLR